MQGSRLVPLVPAADSFEAHVLTARLQAEGIPCQLRGAADGPYPGVGSQIEILVPESELALASEVLLADEIDATFLDLDVRAGLEGWEDSDTFPSPRRRRPTWLVTVAILIVFLFAMTVLCARVQATGVATEAFGQGYSSQSVGTLCGLLWGVG